MRNFRQKTAVAEKDRSLKMPSVTDYMANVRKLITFTPETEIADAIHTLLTKKITGAPVLNSRGEVVGMIDDKDCLKVLLAGAYYNHPVAKDTVASYMTDDYTSANENSSILDITNIFLESKFKRVLITNDAGKLVGQISRRDILRAIEELKVTSW